MIGYNQIFEQNKTLSALSNKLAHCDQAVATKSREIAYLYKENQELKYANKLLVDHRDDLQECKNKRKQVITLFFKMNLVR